MPMTIANLDEYDKVINVSWYTPETPREELTFVMLQIPYEPVLTLIASHAFYHSHRCTHCAASI